MGEIRADLSQFYPLKALFEQVLGRDSFAKLKDGGTFPLWKAECRRLLRALQLTLRSTVQVADQDWRREVQETFKLGHKQLASAKTVTDLFAHLSATLARLSFLQAGNVPCRWPAARVPITAKYWTLSGFRSVQYVQSPTQKAAVKFARERRKKGSRP